MFHTNFLARYFQISLHQLSCYLPEHSITCTGIYLFVLTCISSPLMTFLALLARVLFLYAQKYVHAHTRILIKTHKPSDIVDRNTQTCTPLRGRSPQAPSCFKRRNLLSTLCVCAPSTASVNFKRPACSCELNS